MGNGKKISPTIFKKISGNHREKDLGGSIYGLARTSFFFKKNPPPLAPPGPFKFENSGPKIDNYQFKKQIFSLSGKDRERDLGGSISGLAKIFSFFQKTTPPAPLDCFKS